LSSPDTWVTDRT